MFLKSKLKDLGNLMWKYKNIFEGAGTTIIKNDSGVVLEISNYKIQIPFYGLAIRDGLILSKTLSENCEQVWEVDDCVRIIFSIKENNPEKYVYCDEMEGEYFDTISDYLLKEQIRIGNPKYVDCYIDLSEFATEKEADNLIEKCQKEWEEPEIISEEIIDDKDNPVDEYWNKYLKEKEIKRFRESDAFWTPREEQIINIVRKEQDLSKVPFEVTEYDMKFYKERLSEYEEMKRKQPNKECFFDYSSSSGE